MFTACLVLVASNEKYKDSATIEQMKNEMMKQLESYVVKDEETRRRYVELLLYLPMLYGVNEKMVNKLFCQHLNFGCDVRTFLKETVKRFSAVNPQKAMHE